LTRSHLPALPSASRRLENHSRLRRDRGRHRHVRSRACGWLGRVAFEFRVGRPIHLPIPPSPIRVLMS
jgi:hypothetical protein